VRDVAGHVVGQAVDTISGTIGTRTPDDQAAALRGEPPTTHVARLSAAMDSVAQLATVFDDAVWSAPSPVPGLTLGQGVHALLRDDSAAADPAVAPLLGVSSERFEEQTGMGAHDFLLAATGRCDPARLGLPGSVNMYR
jgi:hypothetical protein